MERLSLSPMPTVNDDMKEDPLQSDLENTLLSNLGEATLTPEDLAWADSCLNKDADATDADWIAVKDALLEIFKNQQEPPVNPSAAQSSMQLSSDPILYTSENPTNEELDGGSDEDEDLIDDDDDFGEVDSIEISEDEGDSFIFRRKRRQGRGKVVGNVFRPNYSEDVQVENPDSDLNMILTANEEDTSQEDIFKVWDLGVSDEQDDFTKQLNKALDGVPPQVPSDTNDSVASKDMLNFSIDDLISGIGDLSLKQHTY